MKGTLISFAVLYIYLLALRISVSWAVCEQMENSHF